MRGRITEAAVVAAVAKHGKLEVYGIGCLPDSTVDLFLCGRKWRRQAHFQVTGDDARQLLRSGALKFELTRGDFLRLPASAREFINAL